MTTNDEAERRRAQEYDPFSVAAREDPPAHHRALRAHCPVHRFDGYDHPLFTISRYEDVEAMLGHWQLWSSRYGQMPQYFEEGGIRADPPEHTIYRRLVTPIFEPRRIEGMAARCREIADGLIDRFAARGRCDLVKEFAHIYPVTVAADLLGVDPEKHDDFRQWSDDFIKGANEGSALEGQARTAIYGYFSELLARRRAMQEQSPADLPQDAITIFVQGRHPQGRPFTDEEIHPVALLLLVGGTDTTSLLLGSCIHRLLENGLWEAVRANPALAEVAIEESLRFDSPVMGTFRTNTEPLTLHGVQIPENSKCENLIASANRDEAVWDEPDRFRLDRDLAGLRTKTLAFGRGIHTCVGARLARLDAAVALRALAERLPGLARDGAVGYFQPFTLQGVVSLPVRWNASDGRR
ncbi:MAG: cytochrome P450 [Gammaproteobacteria bacterium]